MGDCLGQSIAYGHIFQTCICGILKITVLHLEVLATSPVGSGIIGVDIRSERIGGVGGSEVVEMLLQSGSLPLIIGTRTGKYGAVGPIIAFEYALEEYSDIETFPLGIECDTKLIAGSIVAYDYTVAGLVGCILTGIHNSVAVEVGIHDVARHPFAAKGILVS